MELNLLKIPISCLAAPAAALIFGAFLLVSAGSYPQGFSPLDVGTGDLGNGGLNPGGAGVFNAGCMITGALMVLFFAGLYKWYAEERWRNLFVAGGQAAGFAAGVSLAMTGYYPELFASEHSFWATTLFVSLLLALLLANAGLLTHWKYSNWVGCSGLAAVAVIAVAVAGMFAGVYVPAFEWASLALAFIWMLAMAADMYLTFT
jgi:hypothetical protein